MDTSRYRTAVWAAAAVLGVFVGCEQPTETGLQTSSHGSSLDLAAVALAQAPEPVGLEKEYQELEERLPGFGGVFLEAGQLVAYVADVNAPGAVEQVRDHFLGTSEKR